MDVAVTGPLLSGIAFLFVMVRLFARQPAKSDLSGWDDIFVILAFIAGLPLAILDVLFHECKFYLYPSDRHRLEE